MNHTIDNQYRYGLVYNLDGKIVGFNLSPDVFIGLNDEEIEKALEAYVKQKYEQDEIMRLARVMKEDRALNLLQNGLLPQVHGAYHDALEMAIKAVEQTRWIPVSERLPEEPKENPLFDGKTVELYLASSVHEAYPFRAYWNGKFFTDGWAKREPIAWMPLPQLYKEEGE